MINRPLQGCRQSGFTLIEILVTAVIIAFGLLSLAGLQAKMTATQMESYQRAHALVLVEDMAARIATQRRAAEAGAYATTGTTTTVGDGDANDPSNDCSDEANLPARDLCEWSQALKGVGTTANDGRFLGAMLGARGCIDRINEDPETFLVTVAWQGLTETVSPSLTCGSGEYPDDTMRRVLAVRVTLADLD
ncbi:type IV pilus modification protein PilV [Thiocapsa bogorovii]|uniref:type IV pilus modification protein PilV n=1 Tax=Thiocapsa bogorovii TaxID=521689 RepID=UPI001E290F41|nr:type IV pilus modification protein PilV [Thiocapsa bogorovii]UHD16157.1 type IV pilus modification protein PilV [Thiocapsa bogorovii]